MVVEVLVWQFIGPTVENVPLGPILPPCPVQSAWPLSRQLVIRSAGRPDAWGLWHFEQVNLWAGAGYLDCPADESYQSEKFPARTVWEPAVPPSP